MKSTCGMVCAALLLLYARKTTKVKEHITVRHYVHHILCDRIRVVQLCHVCVC